MALHIMHVITALPSGGAQTQLASLLSQSWPGDPSFQVVSLVAGGSTYDELVARGVKIENLNMQPGRAFPSRLIALARIIRRDRPDIIQSWLYHADLAAILALMISGRWRKTRLFWGIRCSDVNLEHYARGLRWIVKLLARISRFPEAIVCNSEAGKQAHSRLGFRPKRWLIVDNAIDTERFMPSDTLRSTARRELGIEAGSFVVLLLARLDPMKDHETFVHAVAQVPGAVGLLVGEGTERFEGRERILALGHKGNPSRLLPAADVIVSSSAFGEGFSNSVAEGMACGLPAVVTDVGDSARIVGDTGYVVPPGDPDRLAEALNQCLTEPRDEWEQRKRRARQRIVDLFSPSRAVSRFSDLYETPR